MTPKEIAELVYSEHTPIVQMSIEEAKAKVAELILECCQQYHREKSVIRIEGKEFQIKITQVDPLI